MIFSVSSMKNPGRVFTLIETLVALVVVSFGSLVALALFSAGLRASTVTDKKMVAASLAGSRIEELSAMPPDLWPAELRSGLEVIEDGLNRQGEPAADGGFIRRSVVRRGSPSPFTCELEVSVTWAKSNSMVRLISVLPDPL